MLRKVKSKVASLVKKYEATKEKAKQLKIDIKKAKEAERKAEADALDKQHMERVKQGEAMYAKMKK
jgi:hypothetical protein